MKTNPRLSSLQPKKIHMRNMTTIRPTFLAAGLALMIIPAQAVTVLYSDDFSGDAADNLNSTTPDTTIGTNTWSANTGIKADGSAAEGATTLDQSAYLAFSPVDGKIYTLSATLSQPTGNATGSKWFAVGFTADNVNTVGLQSATNLAAPWVLWRAAGADDAGSAIRAFLGTNTANSQTIDPELFPTGTQTLTIVLDTTADQWSAEWFLGNTSIGEAAFAVDTNPTINYVGFGRNDGAGIDLSSFSLTEAVPEPSAALLGGLGLLALLRRRR
jgi:MYXO-CTERM domain-containing protein